MNITNKRNQIGQGCTYEQQPIALLDNSLMYEKAKNKMLRVLIMTLAIGATLIFTSCNSPAEKVEKAEIDLLKAERNLENANAEYLKDVESYTIKSRDRINANNQRIIEFNARIDGMEKEARADYKVQIHKLEQKNSGLKKRLDEYKAEAKENWQSFKTEFTNDMNELGLLLKSFMSNEK